MNEQLKIICILQQYLAIVRKQTDKINFTKKKQFCSFKLPLNVPIYFHTTCILSRDDFQFHKCSSFSQHRLVQKRWAGSGIKGHRCKVPSLQFSHPMTHKVLA